MIRFRLLGILSLLLALTACNRARQEAVAIDASGQHVAGWYSTHGASFVQNPDQCTPCHGSYSDPAQSGGISRVSCFSTDRNGMGCHAQGPRHPAGWDAPGQHGRLGAMAKPSERSGFAYCTTCHGPDFDNAKTRSCLSCHTKAPHPDLPWHGTTASGTNHVATDPGNAAQCFLCHKDGANSRLKPSTPPTAGAAPGCFNNTLCHGQNVGHPTDWALPANHGMKGAKAAPSASTGFAYCATCHGAQFTGSTGTSCLACHTLAPHPDKPWHGTTTTLTTHTSTDTGNADQCYKCHKDGANSTRKPASPAASGTAPGCYNNTLCHASDVLPPHPAGTAYLAASAHGPDAKANILTCQPCHASPASGPSPRFNLAKNNMASGCETCHVADTAHPTPWVPGRGTTQGAANTTNHASAGNLTTNCGLCHGAALTGLATAPSCMGGPIAGVACHTSSPAAAPSGCTSCHGNPPNGTTAPNRAYVHTSHAALPTSITCATCHAGQGAGTTTHGNGTLNVALSATFNAKSGTASYSSTTFTCSNVSCHGGKTTPSWRETNAANLINVDTDCTKCHTSGTTQYNSYYSGLHSKHIGKGIACTTCHNVNTLRTNHFTRLDTSAMEGPASATIGGGTTKITTYTKPSCTPQSGVGCHGTETW